MVRFQFLIGTVLLIMRKVHDDENEFQFLIGTVLRFGYYVCDECGFSVSIPYRYGITTVFSPFSGSVFFFLPLITLKSLSTSLFIIANILENQAFFKSLFFRLGRQTFFHFFEIFIAFPFVFSHFNRHFFQYFQGFRGRQTFLQHFYHSKPLGVFCTYSYLI